MCNIYFAWGIFILNTLRSNLQIWELWFLYIFIFYPPFLKCIQQYRHLSTLWFWHYVSTELWLCFEFFWYKGGGDVLVACGGGCRNPWAISGPLSHPHISPFSMFLYALSLSFFLFSFLLLKSFFSCHHYRCNIYCFFFTPLLCLLFYPYFFLTHSTKPVVPPHSISKYDFSSAGFVV
jgi:hypothetical protein